VTQENEILLTLVGFSGFHSWVYPVKPMTSYNIQNRKKLT